MNKNYQIIYLNGPSSSGKSTLARALQDKLEQPFLLFGIDQIIYMMPEKLNDWQNETEAPGFSWHSVKDKNGAKIAWKIEVGPYGEKIVKSLKDIVVTLAKSGNNIIIDDVSVGRKQVDDWKSALKDFKVLWVGITAPIEVIEQREKSRGDRKLGSAKWQAERMHEGVNYDVMIDTHNKSLSENTEFISKYIK